MWNADEVMFVYVLMFVQHVCMVREAAYFAAESACLRQTCAMRNELSYQTYAHECECDDNWMVGWLAGIVFTCVHADSELFVLTW